MKRGCVFSHYNKLNKVSDYVIFYLGELRKHADIIVFVSTSRLGDSDYSKLQKTADIIIERENVGYDFYSYKIGLEKLKQMQAEEVIICNDSVFGPFYDLGNVFDKMKKKDCDFWGLTESVMKRYHLQSYFLVFKNSLISSRIFWNFWEKLAIKNEKEEIVEKYEIGLTQYLVKNNFKPMSFVKTLNGESEDKINNFMAFVLLRISKAYRKPLKIIKAPYSSLLWLIGFITGGWLKSVNPTHLLWEKMIVKHKMPFIKIDLLLKNPEGINISGWENVLLKNTGYNVSLIKKHLTEQKNNG